MIQYKKCTWDGVCAFGASTTAALEVFETISTDLTDRSDLDFTKKYLTQQSADSLYLSDRLVGWSVIKMVHDFRVENLSRNFGRKFT